MNRIPILIDPGTRFDRLVVIEFAGSFKGHRKYLCQCDCGNTKIIRGSGLVSKNTLSCGCLNNELCSKLGVLSRIDGVRENGKITSEYRSYASMLGRCYNINNKKYKNYGGRGIKICDRWLESFTNFLQDMGKKPSKEYTLDRIENNGNYELSNCRWATNDVQAANKQKTIRMSFNGEMYHQASFARMCNVTPHSIEYHLDKGKSPEQIFNYFKNKK